MGFRMVSVIDVIARTRELYRYHAINSARTRASFLWCVVTILSFVCLTVGASVPALAFVGAGLNDTMYAYGTGIAMLTAFLFGNKDYEDLFVGAVAIGYALGCMGVPFLLRASIKQQVAGNSVWLFCAV